MHVSEDRIRGIFSFQFIIIKCDFKSAYFFRRKTFHQYIIVVFVESSEIK